MADESPLKRLGRSAAATLLAAAVWLATPLSDFFFFPWHQLPRDKQIFAAVFLSCMALFLFSFGKVMERVGLLRAVLISAFAGVALSILSYAFLCAAYCVYFIDCAIGANPVDLYSFFVIAFTLSTVRLTFLFSVFIYLAYKLLPRMQSFVLKAMDR